MVEILRSRDQTGPLWWRFSSAIVALYSLTTVIENVRSVFFLKTDAIKNDTSS